MVSARGMVQVELKSIGGREKGRLRVEALVLPKISLELPMQQVPFDPKWNHLKGLTPADPNFGTPGRVDMLIGADVYCRTVLYGQWFSPSESPMAIKTWFGRVLSGPTAGRHSSNWNVCCISVASCDKELRRFWEVEDVNLNRPVLSLQDQAVVRQFQENHARDTSGRFIVPLPVRSDAP